MKKRIMIWMGLAAALAISSPAAAFEELDVTASFSPNTAPEGSSVTFFWDGSVNASGCSVSGVPGLSTTSPFGSFTFIATSSLNASVSCTGAINGSRANGSATANLTVTDPNAPPTVSASISPSSITIDQSTTLSWSSTNATSCSSSGGVSISGTSGSVSFSPSSSTTVTVTCTGPGGSASDSASVTVNSTPVFPPPVVNAFFDPQFVSFGDFSALRWFSSNATFCSVAGFTVGPTGSLWLGPFFLSTTEAVTCFGQGGTTTVFPFIWVSVFGAAPGGESKAAQQARDDLSLSADTPLKVVVEQDFDGDGYGDRLLYLPRGQQMVVQLGVSTGEFRTVKVADGIYDPTVLRSLTIQVDANGNTSVKLTLVR